MQLADTPHNTDPQTMTSKTPKSPSMILLPIMSPEESKQRYPRVASIRVELMPTLRMMVEEMTVLIENDP